MIPRNAQENSEECPRRFRECSKRFWEMVSKKIPGNVQEDSGECSERFQRMFWKIPGNAFNFKLKVAVTCFLTFA